MFTPAKRFTSACGVTRTAVRGAVPADRRARKAIVAAAEQYKLTKFWTLTLHPKKLPVTDLRSQIEYLRECWRKLRVYFARKCGRSIAFIAVVELHKSGVPRLHVLIAEWIDHAWMTNAWSSVGGGQSVWVEPISIRRVAAYLAKYITKERLNNVPSCATVLCFCWNQSVRDADKNGVGCRAN